MTLRDLLKTSASGIAVHKSRSILTMLGIVIGISSIMTIMSVGKSAESVIVGEVQKFGPTNIFVLPGKQPKGPSESGGTLLNDSLKTRDFESLQNKFNVPYAKNIVPFVFGFINSSFESESYDAMIIGSNDIAKTIFSLDVESGRFFDSFDVEQKQKVVVLGDAVKKELFGNSPAEGQKVKIKDQKFMVVGTLSPQGQSSFVDFNKAILSPYTSIQKDLLGLNYFNRLIVEADSVEDVSGTVKDIKTTLRSNHNIDDPENDDFYIQTQEDIANTIKTITGILTVLLSSVAAISLIVGGIGIMNIMLVSATERTKEIGLRKSLGATGGNILSQFLCESLFLTLGGGLIGIVFGGLLTLAFFYGAKVFAGLDFPFLVSIKGIVLGISVSIGIGLIFGIFPARQASKKSPVESLRYE